MKFDTRNEETFKNFDNLHKRPTVTNLRKVIGKDLSEKYLKGLRGKLTVRYGCYREVFIIGDYVFKFPHAIPGYGYDYTLQFNEREVRKWEKYEDGQHLCPIEYYSDDYVLVIMKRTMVLEDMKDRAKFYDLIKRAKVSNAFGKFSNDLHYGNFGLLEDRMVLIDYA